MKPCFPVDFIASHELVARLRGAKDTPLQLSATEDAGTDWESWFQDAFAKEGAGLPSGNLLQFAIENGPFIGKSEVN